MQPLPKAQLRALNSGNELRWEDLPGTFSTPTGKGRISGLGMGLPAHAICYYDFFSEPSQLKRFLSYPGCFWNLRTFVPVLRLYLLQPKSLFSGRFFSFYKPAHLIDSTFHSCTTNNKNYKTEYAISNSISK